MKQKTSNCNNSKIKYQNCRKRQTYSPTTHNCYIIYTIVYTYLYYHPEILIEQQSVHTSLHSSLNPLYMTCIQISSQMIKIFGDQVSDGELNGHIMDVLQISENHETYDIAKPWCHYNIFHKMTNKIKPVLLVLISKCFLEDMWYRRYHPIYTWPDKTEVYNINLLVLLEF